MTKNAKKKEKFSKNFEVNKKFLKKRLDKKLWFLKGKKMYFKNKKYNNVRLK